MNPLWLFTGTIGGGPIIPVESPYFLMQYYRRYLDDVDVISVSSSQVPPYTGPTTEDLDYFRRYLDDVEV